MSMLLAIYRALPFFKGKFRIGKMLFYKHLNNPNPLEFKAHQNIYYKVPNTIENLSLELLINGIYEIEVIKFLDKHLKDNSIFFDIGANIGAIGLPIIKRRKNVSYFAFEATPTTFEYLEYNLAQNKIQIFSANNCLVHERDGELFKFYCGEKNGKNSLAPSYSTKYIEISSISLDTFCYKNDISYIDFLKLDVQGFESFIFKGMSKLLQEKKVRNILFEFEAWAEKDAELDIGCSQKEILNAGYDIYNLKGEKINKIITSGSHMLWAKPRNSGF